MDNYRGIKLINRLIITIIPTTRGNVSLSLSMLTVLKSTLNDADAASAFCLMISK